MFRTGDSSAWSELGADLLRARVKGDKGELYPRGGGAGSSQGDR